MSSSTPSLLVTISSTEHGIYAWELHDNDFTASGSAPTVHKCITAIAGARRSIEAHLETGAPFQPDLPFPTASFSRPSPSRFG